MACPSLKCALSRFLNHFVEVFARLVTMTLPSQSGVAELHPSQPKMPSSHFPDPREVSYHLELRHTLQFEGL